MLDELIHRDSELDVCQYLEISNCKDSIYAHMMEKNRFMIHFFEESVRGDNYRLNDLRFEEPQSIHVGRSRLKYDF